MWGAVFVTFLGLSAFALVVYVATKFFIRHNLWLAAAYDRWLADVLQTSESKHMYIMVLLPDGANAAAMRCPEEEQTPTKDGGPPPTHGGDDEPPVSVLLDLGSEERNPSTCGGCLFGGGATRASEGARQVRAGGGVHPPPARGTRREGAREPCGERRRREAEKPTGRRAGADMAADSKRATPRERSGARRLRRRIRPNPPLDPAAARCTVF